MTDAEWLVREFEFEYCYLCGKDANRHVVTRDIFGHRHIICLDEK